jgi:hypothetical protein
MSRYMSDRYAISEHRSVIVVQWRRELLVHADRVEMPCRLLDRTPSERSEASWSF